MGYNTTTRYNKKGFILIPNNIMTHGGSVIKPWKPLLNKPRVHIQRSHGIYNGHGYGSNPRANRLVYNIYGMDIFVNKMTTGQG